MRAPCADRLDLVDAAFDRPGSPTGHALKALCASCPARDRCLGLAMEGSYEWGIWGGTSPKERTQRGGPRHLTKVA